MKLAISTPPQWENNPAVLATWEGQGSRSFALEGRSDVITAQVIGEHLYLATERSAAHKVLLAALESSQG